MPLDDERVRSAIEDHEATLEEEDEKEEMEDDEA
jgi:hypothetical protein